MLQAFTAGYSTPKDNVHLLDDLVGTRHEMAQLMGAPSYAHYTLKNATLAGCPEAVESFLLELLAAIQPKVMVMLRLRQACQVACLFAYASGRSCATGGRGDEHSAQIQGKAPWKVKCWPATGCLGSAVLHACGPGKSLYVYIVQAHHLS